jgi:hypothetical protein
MNCHSSPGDLRRLAGGEVDMARNMLAGFLGAITAVILAFLVVALVSAVAGVPEMFNPDRAVYGCSPSLGA